MTGLIDHATAEARAARVLAIVRGVLPPAVRASADVTADSSLHELGLEPLDAAMIGMGIEDEFGVPFPDSTGFACETVGEFIGALARIMRSEDHE